MVWLALQKAVDSVRAGHEFELHCDSVCLSAANQALPTFQGPGSIRIGQDRKLRFRMYAASAKPFSKGEFGVAGELISDDSIYCLTATGMDGIKWFSDKIPSP